MVQLLQISVWSHIYCHFLSLFGAALAIVCETLPSSTAAVVAVVCLIFIAHNSPHKSHGYVRRERCVPSLLRRAFIYLYFVFSRSLCWAASHLIRFRCASFDLLVDTSMYLAWSLLLAVFVTVRCSAVCLGHGVQFRPSVRMGEQME